MISSHAYMTVEHWQKIGKENPDIFPKLEKKYFFGLARGVDGVAQ